MNTIGSISLIFLLTNIEAIQIDGKMTKLSNGLYRVSRQLVLTFDLNS